MLKVRFFAPFTLLIASLASAQIPSPVRWAGTVVPAKVRPGQRAVLALKAKIEAGWHLYSMTPVPDGPFTTAVRMRKGGAVAEFGKPVQVKPLSKLDPNFGKTVEFYEDAAEFRIPFRVAKTANGALKVSAEVEYQTCDDRTCLPPTMKVVVGTVKVEGAPIDDKSPLVATFGSIDAPGVPPASSAMPTVSADPQSAVAQARSRGLLAYLGLAVASGFLALLTPCVFPMIPITVSFFSKKKEGERPLPKALAYCAGIVGTFTALGVAVSAIFGATGVQALANNPYLNLALAFVFVALAFSLFGFFEIGVPSSVLNRIDRDGKAGLLGPVLMGLTFSLTSFTCTLPFVGAVLFSASQGDLLWPVLGMVGFSATFCVPFFLLALFPALLAKMPKAGGWLGTVKAFMGFVELAAAVKFVSSVDLGVVPGGLGWVTREVYLSLWFAVAFVAGLYLVGVVRLPKVYEGDRIGPFRYAFGASTFAGSVLILAALNGRSLGTLEAFLPPSPYPGKTGAGAAAGERLAWLSDYEEAVSRAKAEGKPIFIDFTGAYCTNCRDMEKNVFPVETVNRRLARYVRVRLYTDRKLATDQHNQRLMIELTKSVALPSYVTVDPSGKTQVTAYDKDPEAFATFLDQGLASSPSAMR